MTAKLERGLWVIRTTKGVQVHACFAYADALRYLLANAGTTVGI